MLCLIWPGDHVIGGPQVALCEIILDIHMQSTFVRPQLGYS